MLAEVVRSNELFASLLPILRKLVFHSRHSTVCLYFAIFNNESRFLFHLELRPHWIANNKNNNNNQQLWLLNEELLVKWSQPKAKNRNVWTKTCLNAFQFHLSFMVWWKNRVFPPKSTRIFHGKKKLRKR